MLFWIALADSNQQTTTPCGRNSMEKIGWPLIARLLVVSAGFIIFCIAGILYMRKKKRDQQAYLTAFSANGLDLDQSKRDETPGRRPSMIARPVEARPNRIALPDAQESRTKINNARIGNRPLLPSGARTANRPRRTELRFTGLPNVGDTSDSNATGTRQKRRMDGNIAIDADKSWYTCNSEQKRRPKPAAATKKTPAKKKTPTQDGGHARCRP